MNANTPQWEAPADFCAPQFHSVQWLAFVAGTPSITFNFTPFNCEDGNGLQVQVYGSTDCDTWFPVSNCDPGVPPNSTTVLNASGLVPGGTYFFVIDGNVGDVCQFQIDVVSGSTVAPQVMGSPFITGPNPICTGGLGTYTANGVTGAGYYNWTLNGSPIGDGSNVVDVDFPNTGNYQLCVTAGNSCYGNLPQVCTTIMVGPLPLEVLNITRCQEDLPYIYQGMVFTAEGIYNFDYSRPDGCVQPVRLTLNVVEPIPPTNISADICQGQVYNFGGQAYGQTGYYVKTFNSYQGCDSMVNLTLTVHPPDFLNLGYIDHCSLMGPYYVGPHPVTQSGAFNFVLQNQYGCDSTVVGYLNIVNPEFVFIDTVICEGEVVQLGNFAYSQTGNYQDSYEYPDGCNNTFQLNLVVYDPETTIDTVICPGESVHVGNSTYTTSGSYTKVLPAQYLGLGCDSTVHLNLTVLTPIQTNIQAAICEGESYTLGSSTYTQSGVYTEVFPSSNGCDSTVRLTLTVYPDVVTTLNESVCFGESFTVGSSTFTQSGNYQVDLLTSHGCDSTVTLNLTVKDAILTVLDESICDGSSFTVGGIDFSTEGQHEVVLTAADGCDSTVTLNLTLLENPETVLNPSICLGQSYTVGSSSFDQTGTYTVVLPAANGCDSTVTLNLNVLGPIINNISRQICTGQTYTVGNQAFDMPGNYSVTLVNNIGCDSIVNLTLAIRDVLRDTLVTSLCEGDSYTVGSDTYSTTGFYENAFVTAQGCDSVFYLDLTIVPTRYTTLDEEICDGESVMVGGNTYTTSGTFEEMLLSAETGCDSIVTLNLTVLDVPETFLNEQICDGESFGVGASTYTTTGSYADTLVAANGCDSIVFLNLQVLDVPTTMLDEEICDGESFAVGSSVYSATGVYVDTLVAANGCDSIVTLDLLVKDVPETFLNEEICQFESFQVGSSVYTASGSYVDVLTAANGCDSIVNLSLVVHPIRYRDLDISICNGATYTVGTSNYNQTGVYVDTLISVVTGCDSIVTLDLHVTDFYEINLVETICEGESYTVGSNTYTQTGNYSDNFISSDGCDSIVNLALTVLALRYETVDATICDGESFAMGGMDYFITGTFVDTLTSVVTGCDSIVTLNLLVNPVFETNLTEEICDGESYPVGGSTYTTSGNYQDILTASNGCDSVVNLALTVHPIPVTNLAEVVCFGDTYSVGSSTYSASGSYQDILTAVTGCDSIVNLALTVRPEITTGLTQVLCYGEDFTVGTSTYTASGIYMDTLVSAAGCDSIVTLNLTVRAEITTDLTQEICDGESYTVGTSTYTTSGVYMDTLQSVATGCDSIVTLGLTVHPIPQTDLVQEICDGESFSVGGSSYTTTGQYQDVLTSAVTGCDSIVNLALTVHPIPVTNLTQVVCFGDTYSVGSSTYAASGSYQDVLTAATGCDSIVNLALTVRPQITTQLAQVVCYGDDFTVGTSTYAASGVYTDTLVSLATGCDSIVTLNLTVRSEITTSLTQEICDGESYNVGASAYTVSGVYADTLMSLATGCDSIVTLDLTVHPIPQTDLVEEICQGETFPVGGSVYTTTGQYQDVLSSVVTGCDSIVNLALMVHPIPVANLVQELCDGESITVGTSTYTTTGQYQDVLSSAVTGCDSIVNLALTVHPIPVTNLVQEICSGESYTVGASTYSASGSYQDVLTSAVTGCDSIVNLALTVNPVYDIVLDEDICEGDSFPVGNNSFTQGGTYTEVLSSVNGCDSVVTLNLSVYPCALEYEVGQTNISCSGMADGSITFEMQAGTPPYQYSWHALPSGPSGSGMLDGNNLEQLLQGLPAGQYQVSVVDSSPFSVSTTFNLTLTQPDPIDISLLLSQYSNFNTSCYGESDGSIDATVVGGTPPYNYHWSTGGRLEDLDGLAAGSYSLTVSDQHACPDSASALLNAPAPLSVALESIDPPCYGDESGIIIVNGVNGGVGPYLYSIDGSAFGGVPQFGQLGIGEHTVEVQDANGCLWEDQMEIYQPEQLAVELGIDKEIKLGDSIQLYAQTTYPVTMYRWEASDDLSCLNCPDPYARPFESTAFSVRVTDENGCTAFDRITVFVDRRRNVFIPNVFSPNGDGQNDRFTIFTGPEAVNVKSFLIFNRWGEPMYELHDFDPNNPAYGWDGTHRGELMNGGVYVYMAEIEFVDGVTELYKGDILLLR
ncbi:MAG: gliding motility-associated C-terminal domain-containing protein [Phaeodactylibacter sp.]|nr:gliding motility-associated C-terminal domain-containing protein [Phaeodactylibacter sp.]